MTTEQTRALQSTRAMLDLGHPLELILSSGLIPEHLREFVLEQIRQDQNFALVPARTLVADPDRPDWIAGLDRSSWYYWPALRQYLLTRKQWGSAALRSLDDSSDRVLRQLDPPSKEQFDIRGLVLGFIQSGKTANFTAVIAKAADAGYRLVIVLSGIDNGLRRQTNSRLKRELIGYPDDRPNAVRLPPMGHQWHEFTRDEFDGDFQPGFANHAALQGTQPVLLVVKKNGHVLRRLLGWLDAAPPDVARNLPMLVIDDEADQASVDTRGTFQQEDAPPNDDYEAPSPINSLIRDLLRRFHRRAYVAYTATPFANILIPHDTSDPSVGNDLYPKDFIIDLPKPVGYFGAEEFFGRIDSQTGQIVGGLNVLREVSDSDLAVLEEGAIPDSLRLAVLDFVLAGAARAYRGDGGAPATMLIHTSSSIAAQASLRAMVETHFLETRDEWRYQRNLGFDSIRSRFSERWNSDFRPTTQSAHLDRDVDFSTIEPHIGPFLEAVQVREINSDTGDILDYEREPNLKAIAIGGNRLSRGLTLEGLTVSYFVRRSVTYDTLLQMGRWFGFRAGYEDLTRIHTTGELEGWFIDLANVEYRLREDIGVYESQGLTPRQVGMRIWQHPVMQVTSRLKRRYATRITISQTYSNLLEQTFKFPFDRPNALAEQADQNRAAAIALLQSLGPADQSVSDAMGPAWLNIDADIILGFLRSYATDSESRSLSVPLIVAYIERMRDQGELIRWTVAIRGRATRDPILGEADWASDAGFSVSQISRSRILKSDSVGVITNSLDQTIGLSADLMARAQGIIDAAAVENRSISLGNAARQVRPAENGLLLLYPISRFSGYELSDKGNRRRLFANPNDELARNLIGIGLSFPPSRQPQQVEAFLEGTVGWRPVE